MADAVDKTAPTPAGLLRGEHIALFSRGVSAIVASRNAAHHPSLMRAVGTTISADGTLVTVYLNRLTSGQLLNDLESRGPIAVVFSEPSSNRTLQLKAGQVHRLRPATAADHPLLQGYMQAMEWQLGRLGFGPPCARTMLAHELDDVVAVEFMPELAYDQTPGAQAGNPLASGGGRP